MDDVMKAAREAAKRAAARQFLTDAAAEIDLKLDPMSDAYLDELVRERPEVARSVDPAISAYEAKLDETTVRVPKKMLEKIVSRAADGHGYWYGDFHTGSKADDQFSAEWQRDIAEARAMLAATEKE